MYVRGHGTKENRVYTAGGLSTRGIRSSMNRVLKSQCQGGSTPGFACLQVRPYRLNRSAETIAAEKLDFTREGMFRGCAENSACEVFSSLQWEKFSLCCRRVTRRNTPPCPRWWRYPARLSVRLKCHEKQSPA